MREKTTTLLSLILALTAILWTMDAARAQIASLRQITTSTSGGCDDPSISADGTKIAFVSTANLGSNSDGSSEVYLFDLTDNSLTQITNKSSGRSDSPNISSDGTKVVFVSTTDLVNNNDGNSEIFLFDSSDDSITQITDTTSCFSANPSINDNGSRIAFESTSDLTGGNPDGNLELFLFDEQTGFSQITNTALSLDSFAPSVNDDGTKVAFQSERDLDNTLAKDNPDGNSEIFLFDSITGAIAQMTDTVSGDSSLPSISGDGKEIAFESSSDLAGTNPEGNLELFILNVANGSVNQITARRRGNSSFAPSISGDGAKIAFQSNRNLDDVDKMNGDRNLELFFFNGFANRQLTNTADFGNHSPSANDDGTRIAFVSNRNFTRGNLDKNFEVFLARIANLSIKKAALKFDKKSRANKDMFKVWLVFDPRTMNIDPTAAGVIVSVGTFGPVVLSAQNFMASAKGNAFYFTPPKGVRAGVRRLVVNNAKGTIFLSGKRLSLGGTQEAFTVSIQATGVDISDTITGRKKKNKILAIVPILRL